MASLRACALASAEALEASRDELCRLDSAAGDADHGVTMALAARAARQALADAPDASGADLLLRLGAALGSVGGASGPLYASALVAAAVVMRGRPLEVELREGFEAAEAAIAGLGHAAPGDKTMLDALHPAVVALQENPEAPLDHAVHCAAAAARAGAESTASMTARAGRASRLGERSRGLADPGATSVALILEAAASCL